MSSTTARPPSPGEATPAAAMTDRERACWVAFNRARGIGTARFRRLLAHFGSLEAAWQAPRREVELAGLDRRALDALDRVRATLHPERELERALRCCTSVLTWQDEGYPRHLATISDPPPVLYVRGRFEPADEWALAMVGTRRPTVYGREVAERLAADVAAAGIGVVSGLAKGIDTHAHRGALSVGGRTIAVLGHGLDTCYPPENRRLADQIAERGALVTDYALGVAPAAENFPPRNRIISGLAAAVLVVEAGEASGALITSTFAGEQGRDVLAVPGPIFSQASRGCHRLIQDGAKLVTCADDVLAELRPQLEAGLPRQLSLGFDAGDAGPAGRAAGALPADAPPLERALLAGLEELGQPTHVDHLARHTGRPVQEVSALLTVLEVQGRVRHVGGMRYTAAGRPASSHRSTPASSS